MSTCPYSKTAGGCRRNHCRLLHQNPENAQRGPTASAKSPTSKPRRPQTKTGAPNGVCKFYFAGESCKRNSCTYRHTEPDGASFTKLRGSGAPSSSHRGANKAATLAERSLEPAGFSPIPASKALYQLSIICASGSVLTKPAQIMKFVNLLANASSKDSGWDEKDCQRFLEIITETHGLSRIETVLTFDPVIVQVNARREPISFTSAYIPCLGYLVSRFVLDSTMGIRVNSLYGLIHTNFDRVSTIITTCMTDITKRKSFEDRPFGMSCGAEVFRTLIQVLVEYISRFKGAFRDHQTLVPLTESISSWVALWDAGGFVDTEMNDTHAKQVMLDKLHRDLKRLLSMATRETAAITRRAGPDEPALTKEVGTRSVIGALAIHYDPAGNLRPDGPRHNNDFDDIREISIAPTEEEMMCKAAPFLPGNIPGAPHHLASESMERLLDIQFRLLREELVAPLRMTLQSIINDLRAPTKNTLLHAILAKKGGRYTAENGHADSAMASVYTSANPISIATDKRGVVIRLLVNAPPGQARDSSAFKRAEYWKGISRKRLMQGGLVGLVWETQGEIQLFFGLISSSGDDIQSSCRRSAENLEIRVRFFDENMSSKVMDWCQLRPKDRRGTTILMVEAPVMYESIRPFLETLKKEPTGFPFSRYLVHNLEGSRHLYQTVPPPQYTSTRRAFTWNLKCLMNGDLELLFNPQDTDSIQMARQQLRSSSRLDPSQADAMLDCLTKEFCLIQGPPGTGKSFTGIEIMRVLLANNVNKILLIAFTNHALDHLLQSVLKMGITSKIARLGSHSNDEDLKQFSLEELEKSHSTSRRSQSINDAYGNLKEIERELDAVLKQLQGGPVSVKDRTEYMVLHFPDHNNRLLHPPSIVSSIRASEEGWTQAGSRKPLKGLSHFQFWKTGRDIVWLEQAHSSIKKKVKHRPSNSFAELEIEGGWDDDEIADLETEFGDLEEEKEDGLQAFLKNAGVDTLPSIPTSNRTLGVLQDDPLVWAMSRSERTCLAKSWEEGARQHFFSRSKSSFASMKTKYEHAKQQYEECRYQAKLRILSNVDIIGCTTTGAAKLTTLLSGTRPSVLLVEEAGQVLEAHILGSLVPSIEHVIMIGDPLQLRPTINNYSLSMDHHLGKQIYKFDQSTMERLDNAGMRMSQLSVQRRMRPEIASIARLTLYPHLEDNIRVTEYPAVRGLARNIFFFNHAHAEGGGDDESMSKFNTFEITMVKALVQHLLRQGPYTKAGSIVVLCMYLGQLAKLRDELQKSRIRVVLDSRDEDELRNREGDAILNDEDVPIKASDVKLSEQVLLRTVDNFQGEEADVVILSLVRNHGDEKAGTIGFLKSPNRVNVALTRARHGLFVFGNGDLLSSKSDMWTKVTNYFKETDCYGTGLPIACHLHPDTVRWVDSAEKLRQVSPEGGCLRPCGYGLKCRHTCPSKCHADDPAHQSVRCREPCRRTCKKGHPCNRICWEDCIVCSFPVPHIILPCGHTRTNATCHMEDKKDSIVCSELVEKKLPSCEHLALLACHMDPTSHTCNAVCTSILPCCGKSCQGACGQCQKLSTITNLRDNHVQHRCERILQCQHLCGQPCNVGHNDTCGTVDCSGPCRQNCDHHKCRLSCSTPCSPCAEPCLWSCPHHHCPVPCGSPCVRLPCDVRCPKTLACGHPCPSLCGEPCGKQLCHRCASPQERKKVMDSHFRTSVEDLDTASDNLDNITITLGCGHTFTVETLDSICELEGVYQRDFITHQWIGPSFSQPLFVKTPGCPTCHHPIDARRYGRVTKRSNLDLLERNIATRLATQLRSVHQAWLGVDHSSIEQAVIAQSLHRPEFTTKPRFLTARETLRNKLLSEYAQSIVPSDVFCKSLLRYSSLPKVDANQWKNSTKPLLEIYEQVSKILDTRNAHNSAYQASLSILFESELKSATESSDSPEYPEAYALKMARLKVGTTPACADARFVVEGIWITLDIRFALGALAERVYSRLSSQPERNQAQIDAWGHFTTFIYDTCSRDAGIAFNIASSTQAHRQKLLTSLRIVRSVWRNTRFLVTSKQSRGEALGGEERINLMREVEERLHIQKKNVESIREAYVRQGVLTCDAIERDFGAPAQEYLSHWETLVAALRQSGVFYQAVSEKEAQGAVESFTECTHRSHWQICPNGHIFTIGACGSAVSNGRCYECKATTSDVSHQIAGIMRKEVVLENIMTEWRIID